MTQFLRIALLSFFSALTAAGDLPNDTAMVQLASRYQAQVDIQHYLVSEKLDGIRARWTGSQLITRNGNTIHAPPWFTKNWPDQELEGELWTQRGEFERVASIVLTKHPDERWRSVTMKLFDLPAEDLVFADRVNKMSEVVRATDNPYLSMIPQLAFTSIDAMERHLDNIIANGGEGLMLHHKQATYQHGRNPHLLKLKRYDDAEAKVIAHLPGKGKFKGMMGSLMVKTSDGMEFKIGSGFSHNERLNPPPPGSWITFKYYGLTRNGIPRFASFLHVRPQSDRPQ
ncbi:DNA ligase [Alteromonas sp. H39]|uniref:DNA ligase n=1 Tax=Alteromonas sp. H39 TaxID=3389876 RepID=UPI0039E093F7